MPDLDELLQDKLSQVEEGAPVEQVIASLPPDGRELAVLIELAAAARNAPVPQMSHEAALLQSQRLAAALREQARQPLSPAWPGGLAGLADRLKARRWLLAGGLAVLLVIAAAAALLLTGPAAAQSAQLTDVKGIVQVASSSVSSDWRFVTGGQQVREGQRIRTFAGSSVTLAFFEGSRTAIGADADLVLTRLSGGWGNALRVMLSQMAGQTTSDVVPLSGNGSFFVVDTPSGQASVSGTRFNVEVRPDGQALFAVDRGKVQVKTAKSDLYLTPGQAVAVLPGDGIEPPGYQFTLNGSIDNIEGDDWTIAGVKVSVTAQTEVLGDYKTSKIALVQGRIQPDGSWIADSIQPSQDAGETCVFVGPLEAMGGVPGDWKVGGIALKVGEMTRLGSSLKPGLPVRVSFMVLPDGAWAADSIRGLDEPELATPTASPTDTPTGSSTAADTQTVTPSPSGSPSATPEASPTATVTPTPTGTLSRTPKGTSTASPSGTPRPSATSQPGATAAPTLGATSLPIVTPTGRASATPRPSATARNTPRPTQASTRTPAPTDEDTNPCTNPSRQVPEGLRLARRYGVPYAEIMSWFCKGFGFGEIDLAYFLSRASGLPVQDVFALRSSGMSWLEIIKMLVKPTPTPAPTPGGGGGPP